METEQMKAAPWSNGPVVSDEVVQRHAAVVLDLRVVQIRVEHDGAEGHRESGVGVHERVAPGVLGLLVLLPRECLHQAVDALGLLGDEMAFRVRDGVWSPMSTRQKMWLSCPTIRSHCSKIRLVCCCWGSSECACHSIDTLQCMHNSFRPQ